MVDQIIELAILGSIALISPLVAKKTSIPCVVVEIIIGMVIGQSFLNLIHPELPWLSFLFDFGLIYLLFLAGLEVELEFLKEHFLSAITVGTAATLLPFVLGYILGIVTEIDPWLIGVVSSTTSVGIVLPTVMEMKDLFNGQSSEVKFSDLLLGATAVSDMLSMFLLAFFVEGSRISIGSGIVLILLFLVLYPSYKLIKVYSKQTEAVSSLESGYHFSTRLSMVLMIIFAAMAEVSGVHGVIGAFFAGVVISELLYSREYLLRNLASFGYALFLPAFFLLTGVKVDIVDAIIKVNILLLPGLIVLSFLGKVIGVVMTAKGIIGLKKSILMGTMMWAKLSLVIAAAETGLILGTIGDALYSSLILYSLITAFGAPFLTRFLAGRWIGEMK